MVVVVRALLEQMQWGLQVVTAALESCRALLEAQTSMPVVVAVQEFLRVVLVASVEEETEVQPALVAQERTEQEEAAVQHALVSLWASQVVMASPSSVTDCEVAHVRSEG